MPISGHSRTPRFTPVRSLAIALAGAMVLLALAGADSPPPPATSDLSAFPGRWAVDLRPSPDAPAAATTFEVQGIDGDTFTGTFYNSPVKNGRVAKRRDAVYFAFVTFDNSGPYHHAGKLAGGRLEGTTLSIGREFLSVWTAQREAPSR